MESTVIPQPLKREVREGIFTLSPKTTIIVTEESRRLGSFLAQYIEKETGFRLSIRSSSQKEKQGGVIVLLIDATKRSLGCEGYCLEILNERVRISAPSSTGLFYGCQTLLQLLPATQERGKTPNDSLIIPQVVIEDRPRYLWRGVHLDVGRHFYQREFIKKFLDLLAYHKMNIFHWHLTEDQGWRIEIKRYPRLMDISAWRAKRNGEPYGGFYTHEDIREIVRYARERSITIVPEIEMPGHSQAALAAYPELSCTGGPFHTWTEWGISREVFCPGNDATFEFLENVLSEVIELFPGEYVHIGGDEVPKVRWRKCPKCQERIQREGLKDEYELQSYFVKRISKFLASRKRRLIGWDEITEGGLAQGAIVMSWRGIDDGIKAAQQGHDVIMSPYSHCYFDCKYPTLSDGPGHSREKLSLKKVYSFDPLSQKLTAEEAKHILGAQGNIWTEYISTNEEVELMSFPRVCALAEVLWSSKEARDWAEFKDRLKTHGKRLERKGVNFYRDPTVWPDASGFS